MATMPTDAMASSRPIDIFRANGALHVWVAAGLTAPQRRAALRAALAVLASREARS
jgi:hypothetical protein